MSAVKLYRLRLHPRGATLSPWQADTLFGHLCWAIYLERGKAGLDEFLAPFRAGKPPFVLSDGFRGDLFPRPLLPPPPFAAADKAAREAGMDRAKQEKMRVWLTQAEFERFLQGERPTLGPEPPEKESVQVALKNQINRSTGTTTGLEEDQEQGNLYAVEERALFRGEGGARKGIPVSVYFWAEDDAQAEKVEDLFARVARSGYGKKKSAGYGQFRVDSRETITLSAPDDANGLVALANFVPARDDPREGFYKTRVKYGKLGEGGILNNVPLSPFKRPLLMLTAGSTFHVDRARDFVGRLVVSIHRENPQIVQSAFAPAIPIRLPAQGA